MYKMFFVGSNFAFGHLCTLRPKKLKKSKNLKNQKPKTFSKNLNFSSPGDSWYLGCQISYLLTYLFRSI